MLYMNVQFCSILLEQGLGHRAKVKPYGRIGKVAGKKSVGSKAGKTL